MVDEYGEEEESDCLLLGSPGKQANFLVPVRCANAQALNETIRGARLALDLDHLALIVPSRVRIGDDRRRPDGVS